MQITGTCFLLKAKVFDNTEVGHWLMAQENLMFFSSSFGFFCVLSGELVELLTYTMDRSYIWDV